MLCATPSPEYDLYIRNDWDSRVHARVTKNIVVVQISLRIISQSLYFIWDEQGNILLNRGVFYRIGEYFKISTSPRFAQIQLTHSMEEQNGEHHRNENSDDPFGKS